MNSYTIAFWDIGTVFLIPLSLIFMAYTFTAENVLMFLVGLVILGLSVHLRQNFNKWWKENIGATLDSSSQPEVNK